MEKKSEFIEIDRELLHSLLSALTLIMLKGKKIRKPTRRHGEIFEIWPGITVVEKLENRTPIKTDD